MGHNGDSLPNHLVIGVGISYILLYYLVLLNRNVGVCGIMYAVSPQEKLLFGIP